MRSLPILFTLFALGLIAWLCARARAVRLRNIEGTRLMSLPSHHGWWVAVWTVVPALASLLAWSLASPALVTDTVLRAPEAAALPASGFARASLLAEARGLSRLAADGSVQPLAAKLAPIYAQAQARYDWIGAIVALLIAFTGGALTFVRLHARFAARRRVEQATMVALLAASLVAIVTTVSIVASLVAESVRFFQIVPAAEFLFGTHWTPQTIDLADPGASLGAVPLFWGTFFIGGVIAMAVAVPLGLLSAIHLSQYARPATRAWAKPCIEVLAGIPTVVYGYFAALTVAPAVRDLGVALGIADASTESALAAGLVMGLMIVPFISSVADDSLNAVPVELREGSLALGATCAETIRHVLLPAAAPGVAAGVLLAVSRAIGETMIVVMAASSLATLTANPFAPATTVTRQIVDLLTGEAAFDSAKTLSAFALGLTLFAVTLALNVVALSIVRRYREAQV